MNGPLELMKVAPLFNEIPRDWRQLCFSHRTCGKETSLFCLRVSRKSTIVACAMAREWKKWEEHKPTLPLTQGEVDRLKSRFPNFKIVGTRWVLTPKEPDFKARLVVQGYQEDSAMMRTDSPFGQS